MKLNGSEIIVECLKEQGEIQYSVIRAVLF